jgi:2',3'-cyclic-nucleotide 2'-phosphodiesterase (5'-nucleotidase family)
MTSAFKAKIDGHLQPILCANLRAKNGDRPLPEHLIFERGGIKIGVFGVMVPMVTERMATQAASVYLWDPPIATAIRKVDELRSQVDCLVALTHIGHRQDHALVAQCPQIDVIFGGHSHTLIEQPERVGETFICQGASHGKYVGVYDWRGRGQFAGELIPLP